MGESLKALEWLGDSLKRVRGFFKPVRQQVGYDLELVQHGLDPSDWKPMATVGSSVNEIRIHAEAEHRLGYLTKLPAGHLRATCFP